MTKETLASSVAAAIFVLLGLFAVQQSLQLAYYTANGPGPGFFPLWIGAILAVVALLHLVHVIRARSSSEGVIAADPQLTNDEEQTAEDVEGEESTPLWPGKAGVIRVAVVLGAVLYVSVTIDWLGFQLSMLSMLAVVLTTLGRQRILVTALVSGIGSFGVYFVFTQWLSVHLPTSQISWLTGLGL